MLEEKFSDSDSGEEDEESEENGKTNRAGKTKIIGQHKVCCVVPVIGMGYGTDRYERCDC